jgi:ABC-type sugar transport system ATPase subunit
LIQELRSKDLPVMIVAHNLPLVVRLTDRIVILRHGRVAANLKSSETTPRKWFGSSPD